MQISATRHCPFCGSNHKSKPFCTYADGYHCYSCGAHKSADRTFQSNNSQTKTTSCVQLPILSSEFTLTARNWLAQYDVDDAMIAKYSIMQADDGSVVLPVKIGDEIKMYQRRWLSPRQILTYGKKLPFFSSVPRNNNELVNTIVIVEDFISCIKVGEVCQAVACLGTSIDNETIQNIVQKYDNIVIWLDGDKPGQEGASKLQKRIKYYQSVQNAKRAFLIRELRTYNIVTEQDPKCFTKTEIKNIIYKHSLTCSNSNAIL